MVDWGYTMMCEQTGPRALVDDVVSAEAAGFDFAVISDHYFPWLEEQGHSPYAWSVLGAAAWATSRIPLMTYVTCPTFRYHPAVVAQKAATIQLLSKGRFTLGLGPARTSTSTSSARAGRRPTYVRSASKRRSRSSARCSVAATSTTAASTSRSSRRGCGTCRTMRRRSASRSRASSRATSPAASPT